MVGFKCITDKHGNFTKDKVYHSYQEYRNINTGQVVACKILDDEYDGFYITLSDLPKFLTIEGGKDHDR